MCGTSGRSPVLRLRRIIFGEEDEVNCGAPSSFNSEDDEEEDNCAADIDPNEEEAESGATVDAALLLVCILPTVGLSLYVYLFPLPSYSASLPSGGRNATCLFTLLLRPDVGVAVTLRT
eukprot:g8908.t1